MKADLTRLAYGVIAITGTKLDENILEELDEIERLSEIGEALELFETTKLDYSGTINNIKVLLAWHRNEAD